MRIREIEVCDVAAGRRWRLTGDSDAMGSVIDWEIEECSTFQAHDTVVYSGLTVFENGEVRPILVVREVGTHDWWGDTCEFVEGRWRELGPAGPRQRESYVAKPLPNDPSFVGEYSHEKQRSGFARWVDRLQLPGPSRQSRSNGGRSA